MKINHYQTLAIDILQEIENYVEARMTAKEEIVGNLLDVPSVELRAYEKGQLAAYLEVYTILTTFYQPEVTPDATNPNQA